jgi:uncharacterized membrane protein
MIAALRGVGRHLVRPFVRRCGLVLGHAEGERGVIAVLAAFLLTVTVTSAALSLDIAGRVAEVRRDQATADLAALDAARNLAAVQTLAAASARRNGVDNTKSGNTVTAVLGQLSVVNGRNVFSAGGSNSAVKVTVSTPYNDFLGGLKGHMVASASASTTTGMAGFSVGATLVDLNAGLAKFGATLALIGYNGLAAGTVTLGALATKLGLSALSPDQVLATNVTVGQIVNASAALLGATSPSYASLTALGTTLGGSARNTANAVQLGPVLGLQSGTGVGLGANVNLMGALSGSIQLANQKAGLSANISLGVPGVAAVSFGVVAFVPPTIAYGPVGSTATNTQVTVNLSVDLDIGLGLLSIAAVHLPITLTLGGAVGTLKAIDCTGAAPVDIKLGTAFPSLSLNVSGGYATLLGLPLATGLTGPITVSSNPVADTLLNYPSNFSNNLVSNLPLSVNSNLSSTVVANLTGSGLAGGLLAGLLDTLSTVVLPIVTGVVSSLTSALGITIGNADYLGIQPPPPTCGAIPRLAS